MIQAVIFCLDGVLVTTDSCHARAWQQMAREQGIPFSPGDFEKIKGLGGRDALNALLRASRRGYSEGEKLALIMRKNDLYMDYISALGDDCILPGVRETVDRLRRAGLKIAVGSSSQNAVFILKHLNLFSTFDAVVDGNQTEAVKPDPEVFLLAARKLRVPPENCLVVEDAEAGVTASHRAGMRCVGLGDPAPRAEDTAPSLEGVDWPRLLDGRALA